MPCALCRLSAVCWAACSRCDASRACRANGRPPAGECDRGRSRSAHLHSSIHQRTEHRMSVCSLLDTSGHALISAADRERRQVRQRLRQRQRRAAQAAEETPPRHFRSHPSPHSWPPSCHRERCVRRTAAACSAAGMEVSESGRRGDSRSMEPSLNQHDTTSKPAQKMFLVHF